MDVMTKNTYQATCRVVDCGRMPYEEAFAMQKRDVARIGRGEGTDVFYLLEHPHVITKGRNAGTDAILADRAFIERRRLQVADCDRGGDVTYHGPGQLVGYPILKLEPGKRSLRRYVHDLEEVLVRTLADFGVDSYRHPVYRGVWAGENKIASIGIRISRWITSHGFALNVSTDLSFFSLIIPCGISGCEMTSMEKILGVKPNMDAVKETTTAHFSDVFERNLVIEKPLGYDHTAEEIRPNG